MTNDYLIFLFILLSVGIGWLAGYAKGVIVGVEYAESKKLADSDYPIYNVAVYGTSDETEFRFVEMATDKHIVTGTTEQCLDILSTRLKDGKKIVFSTLSDAEDLSEDEDESI